MYSRHKGKGLLDIPTFAIICVLLWLGAHIFGLLKKLLTIPVAFAKNLSCFGSVPRKKGVSLVREWFLFILLFYTIR